MPVVPVPVIMVEMQPDLVPEVAVGLEQLSWVPWVQAELEEVVMWF